MTNGITRALRYMRIEVFSEDDHILAVALDESSNVVHLFLIERDAEKAYHRNSRIDQWQLLDREDVILILQSICHSVAQGQIVFQINGNSGRIINRNN